MKTTPVVTLADFLLARIGDFERMVKPCVDEAEWFGQPMQMVDGQKMVGAVCEAQRRILDLHRSGGAWCDHCSGWYGPDPAADCPTLRALALPFAEHPDCREEWKP